MRPCLRPLSLESQRRHLGTRAFLRLADDLKTADKTLSQFPYMSSPHWDSEALVPQFNGPRVTAFKAAAAEEERSELGRVFLRRNPEGLVRCANATVGYKADLANGTIGTGTGFQVSPGGNKAITKVNEMGC